ncbi:ABC transporter permease [Microbacterium hominis]|uniref:ABC transporter permease n=1 Tax=Microbacterium hominis TaxID=162426 RepID=A0A7D4PKN5_9MICO|nr:ABC transporter permease [Microbacterium hominis]QKJ18255.1 ABC transporter permease [Microbacterium hominis]
MLFFILRKIAAGLVLLVVVSFLTFTLLYLSSSNIALNMIGDNATPEQIAAVEQRLGLDQPLFARYFAWVGAALAGDLGTSWFSPGTVASSIASRLPVTLALILTAVMITAIVATALGVLAATRRGWADRLVQVGAIVGDAIPGFVLAVFLITLFAVQLQLLPAISTIRPGVGLDAWVFSLILPVAAIVVASTTNSAQQIRSAVISELGRDYVRTLRSRGIGEREILFLHVLRGAAPAGLTVLGLQFVGLLSASVIVESIFALPGLGSLAVTATSQSDIPVVMGIVIVTVILVVIVNLLVDLANGWLNPKVRVS